MFIVECAVPILNEDVRDNTGLDRSLSKIIKKFGSPYSTIWKTMEIFEGKLIDSGPPNTWNGGLGIYSVILSTVEYSIL